MKLEFLTPINKKLTPLYNLLKRDSAIIFLSIVAVVFGYLIWRIGNLAGAEPTKSQIDEKLRTITRARIDPASIKKIEDLRAQNIDIRSYFVDRNNPFQE